MWAGVAAARPLPLYLTHFTHVSQPGLTAMPSTMTDTRLPSIAFLGIGLMGRPMAANLLAAGYPVSVWNRSPGKTAPLAEAGARAAETVAEAVGGAEVVFTMMSDGAAVGEVLFGAAGAAPAMAKGALVIDCSSIEPSRARDHAERLRARGVGALDAPVSGGPSGAEAASLAIMVGGSEADCARGEPVLEALGRPLRVGPAGAGQLAKLANQIIVGLEIAAVAEALLLASQGGAEPARVREAMSGGFADSLVLQIHGERMLERKFLPGGAARIHLKDFTNIVAEAEACGLDLPFSRTALELFKSLVERGGGGYDHSALLLELEHRNPPARLGDAPDELPD
jgi:2-hydroxy-3-oxopropionate reductase